jgi:hypothetical protein
VAAEHAHSRRQRRSGAGTAGAASASAKRLRRRQAAAAAAGSMPSPSGVFAADPDRDPRKAVEFETAEHGCNRPWDSTRMGGGPAAAARLQARIEHAHALGRAKADAELEKIPKGCMNADWQQPWAPERRMHRVPMPVPDDDHGPQPPAPEEGPRKLMLHPYVRDQFYESVRSRQCDGKARARARQKQSEHLSLPDLLGDPLNPPAVERFQHPGAVPPPPPPVFRNWGEEGSVGAFSCAKSFQAQQLRQVAEVQRASVPAGLRDATLYE